MRQTPDSSEPAAGAPPATVHPCGTRGGYGLALPVLLAAVAIETTLLHLLIAWHFPRAAWLSTAFGVYVALWMVADHRAAASRPILIADGVLHLRAGLRWTASVPLAGIATARRGGAVAPGRQPGYRSTALFGRPDLLLDLSPPVPATGPYGLRRLLTRVGIAVDDPGSLEGALGEAGIVIEGDGRTDHGDFADRLRDGLRTLVRRPRVAALVAHEIGALSYALFFWRLRPVVPPGATAFTLHRKSQYGALLGVLLCLSVVEMVVMHVALSRSSPRLAWTLSALAAYSILWLLGDYQAIRLRPILVDDHQARIRVGLRSEATVPLDAIAAIVPTPVEGMPRRSPGYLRCTPLALDVPDRLLELSHPVQAHELLRAPRPVTIIGLALDDPQAFERAVRR